MTLAAPEEIRRLNREYRERDEATDVLSFPMWEGEQGFAPDPMMPVLPLGDVVICPEETARLHPELPLDEALCLMLAHSFLHLLAWDHDTEERQTAMWARQDEIRARLLDALHAGHPVPCGYKASCPSADDKRAHPCAVVGTRTSCPSADDKRAHPCAVVGTRTSCPSEAR